MLIRQARLEDAARIAKIRVDTWSTTYRGMVPEEYLAKMSYEESECSWTRHVSEAAGNNMFIYVAEDEAGRVVGYVAGGPNRDDDPIYKAELHAIYILQAYQGQGLGRRLTEALVKSLLEVRLNSMILWVLADNPARSFYEALGGQQVQEGQFEIGGATTKDVAYGWMDIHILLSEAS